MDTIPHQPIFPQQSPWQFEQDPLNPQSGLEAGRTSALPLIDQGIFTQPSTAGYSVTSFNPEIILPSDVGQWGEINSSYNESFNPWLSTHNPLIGRSVFEPHVGLSGELKLNSNQFLNQNSDNFTKEIVFIDGAIDNQQSLLADISPELEVVQLDKQQNGIEQISDFLALHQNVSAIHIFSHGSVGNIELGTTNLNSETLSQYQTQLKGWAKVLTIEADILLYGCNVAAGEYGQAFVQKFAGLTGADIAASDDLTGSSTLGGDWKLEVNTGSIEALNLTSTDFHQVLESYLVLENNELLISEILREGNTDNNIFLSYDKNFIEIKDTVNPISLPSDKTNIKIIDTQTVQIDSSLISKIEIKIGIGKDSITFNNFDFGSINKRMDVSVKFGLANSSQETFNIDGIVSLGGGSLSIEEADEINIKNNIFTGGGNFTITKSDQININENVFTSGGSFNITESGGAGGINIADNTTVSTRKIASNEITKHLDETFDGGQSIGKSGDIVISAITKGDDSKADSSALRLGIGVQFLTQASGTYQAGNITLQANSRKDTLSTDILADFGLGGTVYDANILLGKNVVLKGKDITLKADSGGDQAKIATLDKYSGKGLRTIVDLIVGLPLAVKVIDSDAKIDIGTGTQILSSGNVSIESKASSDSSLSVSTSENGFFAPLSIGVSVADSSAETIIQNGVKIQAVNNVDILSEGTSKAVSKSRTSRNLGQKPKDNQAKAISLAVAYSNAKSHTIINEGALISSGGNVNIHAKGNSQNEAESGASIYEDGTAAFTVGVGVSDSNIKAEVNGQIEAKGNSLNTLNLDNATFDSERNTIKFASDHNLKQGDAITYRQGSISNEEIGGLKDGATYYVNVIDSTTIGLSSIKIFGSTGDFVPVDYSKKTGIGHVLNNPNNKTEGIRILAELESTDVATASSGILQDTLINKVLEFDTSALVSAARTSETLKNKFQNSSLGKTKLGKYASDNGFTQSGGNSGNSSSKWGLAGAFSLSDSNHNVTAQIGSTAELRSEQNIDVQAKHRSLVESSAQSTLENLDSKTKDTAVSAAVSVGNYDSTVKAIINNNAKLDAKEKIQIDARTVYPFALDSGTVKFSDIAAIKDQQQAGTWLNSFLQGGLTTAQRLKPWNSWTKSVANGNKLGIAGAVNVIDYNNTVEAIVGSGVQINQNPDDKYKSDTKSVLVEALTDMSLVNLTGNPLKPVGSSEGAGGVGGSIFIQDIKNITQALIKDTATINTGNLGKFQLNAVEDVNNFNIVYSGGSAGKFGVNAGVEINLYESTTIAQLSNLAQVSAGTVDIKALNDADFWNVSGGVNKGEAVGLGASVAINNITRTTKAFIGSFDSNATQRSQANTITAFGAINISAMNGGNLVTVSLAGAISSPPTGSANTTPSGGSYGVGISGSVSINEIKDTTEASVQNAKIGNATNLSLIAKNNSLIVSISGAASLSLDPTKKGGGLAGSYSNNDLTGSNKTYITNSSINLAENLKLDSTLDQTITAVGVSGTLSNSNGGVSLAGQVMINDIKNETFAYIDRNSTIQTAKDIQIKAEDKSTITAIAGAVSLDLGGKLAIGGSFSKSKIRNQTKAYIDDAKVDIAGSLGVVALNSSKINTVSVGVAVSVQGLAASFAYTNNDIENSTQAYIANSAAINVKGTTQIAIPQATSSNEQKINGVAVVAVNTAEINNVAIVFSGSGKVAASANVSTNDIRNVTKAYIDTSKLRTENSVFVRGYSLADIDVKAGAVGFGAKGAVGVSVDVTDIANNTDVYVRNSTVIANSDIEVTSYTREQVDAVVISGAISGVVSIAGNVEVLTLNSKNNAFIDKGSTVKAGGNLTVIADNIASMGENLQKNGDFNFDVKGKTSKVNAVAVGSVAGSAGGGVGGTVLVTNITNVTTAYISDSVTDAKQTTQVKANSKEVVSTLAGTAGIGSYAGVAGTVIVNSIATKTQAYISESSSQTKVNLDSTYRTGNQTVNVTANNNAKINSFSGAIGASLGAGAGASADVNNINNIVEAYLGVGTEVNAGKDVEVIADGKKEVDSVAVAFAAGTLSIQGAIAVTNVGATTPPKGQDALKVPNSDKAFTSSVDEQIKQANDSASRKSTFSIARLFSPSSPTAYTKAYIAANAIVEVNGDIKVKSTDQTQLKIIPGAFGLGIVTIGGAAGVVNLAHDVQAFVGENARLKANGNIEINANSKILPLNGTDILQVRAGQAGLISILGGAAGYITSNNKAVAYVGNNSSLEKNTNKNGQPTILVNAETESRLSANSGSLELSLLGGLGALAGGGSPVEVTENATAKAYLGNEVSVGTEANPVNSLKVEAKSTNDLKAKSNSLAGGVINASSGAKADDTLNTTVTATTGKNVKIYTTNDIDILATSDNKTQVDAQGNTYGGVSAGSANAQSKINNKTEAFSGIKNELTSKEGNISILSKANNNNGEVNAKSETGGIVSSGGTQATNNLNNIVTASLGEGNKVSAQSELIIKEDQKVKSLSLGGKVLSRRSTFPNSATRYFTNDEPNQISFYLGYYEPFIINQYEIVAGSSIQEAPKNWYFYGIDKKGDFVLLDSRKGVVFDGEQSKTFTFNSPRSYDRYKLSFEGVSKSLVISKLDFFNSDLTEQLGQTVQVTQKNNDYTNVLLGKVKVAISENDIDIQKPIPIGEEIEKAFDNDPNTKWLSFSTNPTLQYNFDEPTVVNRYTMTSANDEPRRDPNAWVLKGSNDGINFDNIDKKEDIYFTNRFQTKTFNFENKKPYKYYSLEILQAQQKYGGIIQLAEFKLGDPIFTSSSLDDFTQAGNTSAIQVSTTNSPTGEDGSKAFDNNINTKWLIPQQKGSIQYDFKQPTVINRYTITSAKDEPGRDPKNWLLEASNDGNTFITLDTRNLESFRNRRDKQEYKFVNTTPYRYYRLNVKENQGSNEMQIAEIEFGIQKDNAFDNNLDSNWKVNGKSGDIGYQFEKPLVVNQYTIISAKGEREKDPKAWVLEGSRNGIDYANLHIVNSTTFNKDNESKLFTFSNSTAYRFYRLRVTDNNGANESQIAELDLGRQEREISSSLEQIQDYTTYSPNSISVSNNNSPSEEKPEKAFDNQKDTKWLIKNFKGGDWIQYDFNQDTGKIVNQYSITFANDEPGRDPQEWRLLGSNNNQNFVLLDERGIPTFERNHKATFEFNNVDPYRYYRLQILENRRAPDLQIAEIELGKLDRRNHELFDNKVETLWRTDAKQGSILYDFGKSILINQYRITSGDRNPQADPQSWVFEGSNDGVTFTALDQRNGFQFTDRYQSKAFSFDNSNNYRYYRLKITDNNGADYLKIAELEFAQFETAGTLNVEAINSGNIKADAQQKTISAVDFGNLATSSITIQSDTTAKLDGNSTTINVKNLNILSQDSGFDIVTSAKANSTSVLSDVTARGNIEQANINAKTDIASGTKIKARKVNLQSLQYGVGSEARSEVDNLLGPDEAYTKNNLNVQSKVSTQTGVNIAADTFVTDAVTANGKYIQKPKDDDSFSANDEYREGTEIRRSNTEILSQGRKFDSITVNTLNDENDGVNKNNVSLREAISAVRDGAIITFADNLFNNNVATLNLSLGQLQIQNSLMIDAGNNHNLTIAGNKKNSILFIDDNSAATSLPVTLKGITIQEGKSEKGGGIFNSENLTLINSVVYNNQATLGGGIYNLGTLTINNSNISKNIAEKDGGGIYQNNGALTINNSNILNNQAENFSGGGIYQNNGTLSISNSNLSNNQAKLGGGGIRQIDGTLSISNSTLSNNQAQSGGGIYQNNGTLSISNSTLSNNQAQVDGGGIHQENGTLSISKSTLSENQARAGGGGIYQQNGTSSISNSSLFSNQAGASGGGIRQNNGTFSISNSTLSNNKASTGGGIYQNNGTFSISNSTLSNNKAVFGGGIYQENGTFSISNSTLSNNETKLDGGGIYQYSGNQVRGGVSTSNFTIDNSTISSNKASRNGGGIFQSSGNLTITSSTLYSNVGGGINQNITSMDNAFKSRQVILHNSIIASGDDHKDVDLFNYSEFKTTGKNLIEDGSLKSADIINRNPLLAPLAYNGGLTQTHDLLIGSPAIDASDIGTGTDQRGYSRPRGGKYDIGAVEFQKSELQVQHFDVSSVLNIDVIVNRNQNQIDYTQSSIDNNNKALITESFAKFTNGRSGNGLIDNGFFGANSFHPDIQLSYRNYDDGNNARLLKGTDQFSFDVPNEKYKAIHLAFTSTEGSSDIELKFDYTDGTNSSTKQQIIPDWYSSITETNELYYLINGLDRSNADGTGFEDSNKPAVFGTVFTPDATKILKKITIIKKSNSGNLVFFGATGLKNLT